MGSAVASALLSAGHEVTVFNRTTRRTHGLALKGAHVAETAAEAILSSPYSIVLLTDFTSAREVLLSDATRPALRSRALMSAVAMDVEEFDVLAAAVAGSGGRLSDSNILSYPDAVERRDAEFMMAACPEDAATWRRIFLDLGSKVHDVGAAGNASRAQAAFLFANMFVRLAVAYALAAFEKQKLPVEVLRYALTSNPAIALPYADGIVEGMLKRDYSGDDWSVDMTIRSLDQAIDLARRLDMDAGAMLEVRRLYAKASERGLGPKVANALYEVINQRSPQNSVGQ